MRREGGYTLLELLVVLAIIGLLTLVLTPMFGNARPQVSSLAGARLVAHELVLAREQAIARSAPLHLVVRRTAIVSETATRMMPRDVTLRVTPSSQASIDFFPDGSSSGGTIVVVSEGRMHRVTAHWLSGRIAIDE